MQKPNKNVFLIGLDLGTTAIKGVAMSSDGKIFSREKTATEYIRRNNGFIEFDAVYFYEKIAGVISRLVQTIPEGSEIAGISMASASGNTLLVDESGVPLANAISWMDTRVTDEVKKVFGNLDEAKVYDLVGWPLLNMFPLAHLSWLKCHKQELLAKADKICMTTDFVNFRLTGCWGIDTSTATTFFLQDQMKREWYQPFLKRLGISQRKLPPIFNTGKMLGVVTRQAAFETGLPEGTPVILGSFDHPCAARGSGVLEKGQVLISCGTSWVVFYPVSDREKAIKNKMIVDPFLNKNYDGEKGLWGAMFSIPAISDSIDSLIRKYISDSPERYKEFDRLAAEAPPGANGLVINPLIESALYDDECKSHSRADIARAIMEGAAYLLKEKMESLKNAGMDVDSVVMVGGPSETHPWPEIIGDILGKKISVVNGAYAGAAGAAMIARDPDLRDGSCGPSRCDRKNRPSGPLKIGLLPLYIELYDKSLPQMRDRIDAFHDLIVDEFTKRNIQVVKVPVCRIKQEFADAIDIFETQEVDAIVTLHLAYSPSLESSDVLSSTRLPVIVLNTTPTFNFSPDQNPDEILYNHAIHGVQDMCNLLVRNKKEFLIESGHWEKSDVLDRIIVCIKAAKLAKNMKNSRVGIIGEPFAGMGDFAVPPSDLKSQIGIDTVVFTREQGNRFFSEIKEDEIRSEISGDLSEFNAENLNAENHRQSVISGLILRKWIEKENLSAITVNFLSVGGTSGIPGMPFLEISKAMARGKGYAGEGDILTAALVGALIDVYPQTSFTEMFCADWEGNSVFLSHMGEMNLKVSDGIPKLIAKDFPYADVPDPVAAYARFKGGKTVFVNLAPSQDNTYALIIVSGEMLTINGKDNMDGTVHGWFRPEMPVADFLTMYSIAGGTHHGAIVYGDVKDELSKFGRLMGWKVII